MKMKSILMPPAIIIIIAGCVQTKQNVSQSSLERLAKKPSVTIGAAEVASIMQKCGINNDDRDGCYSDSLGLIALEKNISVCSQGYDLLKNEFNIDRCFKKYFEEDLDFGACEDIIIPDDKIACIREYAYVSDRPEICHAILQVDTINNDVSRDGCLFNFRNKGIEICKQITEESVWYDDCFTAVATKEKDISICKNYVSAWHEFSKERMIDACILDVAMETRDKSLCASIQYPIDRAVCGQL